MPEYIHINIQRLRSNRKRLKEGRTDLEPVVTAKPSRHRTGPYGNRIAILDAQGNEVAYVTYEPENPLPCGAVAWVEASHGTRVKR
jgi:hypothetical protein